jgi:hypothetical protein
VLVAGCLSVVVFARSAAAQDMIPPAPMPDPLLTAPPPPPAVVDPFPSSDAVVVVPPEHLVINDRYFEGTPAGLRSYLESIKSTSPALYAQLSPDADRLQSRATTSMALLAGGLGVGVLSILAGVALRSDCALPSVNDAHFAAAASAWNACNEDNMDRGVVFDVVGVLAALGGMIGAVSTWPTRQDLLDVVNKHNRLSPDPLRLQVGYNVGYNVGYDPAQHTAQASATLSF